MKLSGQNTENFGTKFLCLDHNFSKTFMSLSIGIIGLPNVGKSTLFKALTKRQVDISNYPFCTVSPNVGVVNVPDERIDKLAKVIKPEKILPATIEFWDIAGLVKGAHQGEGLGNQFLEQIRKVDALCHLIRAFPSRNVSHVSGSIDSLRDIETVNLELILSDFDLISKRIEVLEKRSKAGLLKEEEKLLEILKKLSATLQSGKLAKTLPLSEEEEKKIADINLLTRKPVLYVLNVSQEQLADKNWPKIPEIDLVISCQLEAELSDLSEKERKDYIKEFRLEESGIDKLIKSAYQLLDIITFFTIQNKILQAWTIKRGTSVQKAGGKIHTDFEEKFIRAEVINWKDLVALGSELHAREKGKIRIEGKDYLVQDGDVIHFKI